MIEAVTNTSPVRYLVRIGQLDVLPRFYRRVVLPANA